MATLVNRDIYVRDPDGAVVLARCIGQSIADYWIKCRTPSGEEFMAESSDFVRVHEPEQ